MQGISVLTDPNGKPSFLAVDLNHLDPTISPLVNGLLERIQQAAEATERAEWLALSAANLERAYGDNEHDYSETDLIEPNPNYRP